MKTLAVLVCAVVASGYALLQAPPKPKSKFDALARIAGGWETDRDGEHIEEHWIAPAGGLMLGCGRTLVNERAVFFEFLRLEERKDGEVYYVAHPRGRSPGTDFKLTNSSESSWTFENPEHDFPRLIRYTLEGDGALSAHLEGEEKGVATTQDFHYRRSTK